MNLCFLISKIGAAVRINLVNIYKIFGRYLVYSTICITLTISVIEGKNFLSMFYVGICLIMLGRSLAADTPFFK